MKSTLDFQTYDWFSRDEVEEDDDTNENNDNEDKPKDKPRVYDPDARFTKSISKEFVIYAFGKTENGKTVSLRIKEYTPFFWISLPLEDETSKENKQTYLRALSNLLPEHLKDEFYTHKSNLRKKFIFRNYQWNKPRMCIQLVFKSLRAYKAMYHKLKEPVTIRGIVEDHIFSVYEKNVDPLLRFLHIQDLKPAGWVTVPLVHTTNQDKTQTQHALETHWSHVRPGASTNIGKIRIASFDIEADSLHGDFPIAKKDYHKLVGQIFELVHLYRKTKRKFTPSHVEKWISAAFRDYEENPKYSEEVSSTVQTVLFKNTRTAPSSKCIENVSIECYNLLGKYDAIHDAHEEILYCFNKAFPALCGDKVIQIGTVFTDYGTGKVWRHIVTLGTCDAIENTTVVACDTVREVYREWINMIREESPSILTGYNIFGFDFKFLWECAEEYGCTSFFNDLCPIKSYDVKLVHKELKSSALGQNHLYYIDTPGMVLIDLMKVVQKDFNLSSYKLDNVAVDFINGSIKKVLPASDASRLRFQTNSTYSLQKGQFIVMQKSSIIGKEDLGSKRKIVDFEPNAWIEVDGNDHEFEDALFEKKSYIWAVGKDDITPKDIFRLQCGSSSDRALVAKYCVQDCELCIHLMQKLEIVANNIGMANVCLVPFSYLFMRGQMIKTLSLVSRECRLASYLIPELPKPKEDVKESYEGAEVLEPKPAIYLDKDPISVLDYGSLYPSSMIGANISHDTIIQNSEYLGDIGAQKLQEKGIEFIDVTYDNYITVLKGKTWVKKVHPTEKTVTCRYIQPGRDASGKIDDTKRGILPKILMKLLSARKATRKLIATESDPFRRSVLDGLQLAYKVTANSLYGGVGAAVSALYYKDIAASTTAVGREHLHLAKDFVCKKYPHAEVIYGDTDSIFVNFHPGGCGKEALKASIEMAQTIEREIQPLLKYPHKLEYEKTFMPFILFSKKRYIGRKYETDLDAYKQSSMGVVTKRRDNAPIVKYIYDGIISRIMQDQNIEQSIRFLMDSLEKVVSGKFPVQYFVISKTLRSEYANPQQIVHKVLADRIAERDPGNKPQSNDRIPFVYIHKKDFTKTTLQGERVEHPDYIAEHKLKIDHLFYVTNQVMKPVSQIYALALESLKGYNRPKNYWVDMERGLHEKEVTESDIRERVFKKKSEEAQKLLFTPLIHRVTNERSGQPQITSFFSKRY